MGFLLLILPVVFVNRDCLLLHKLIIVLRLSGFLLIRWQVFNSPFSLALLAALFFPLAIFGMTLLLILLSLLLLLNFVVGFRIHRDQLALRGCAPKLFFDLILVLRVLLALFHAWTLLRFVLLALVFLLLF